MELWTKIGVTLVMVGVLCMVFQIIFLADSKYEQLFKWFGAIGVTGLVVWMGSLLAQLWS